MTSQHALTQREEGKNTAETPDPGSSRTPSVDGEEGKKEVPLERPRLSEKKKKS